MMTVLPDFEFSFSLWLFVFAETKDIVLTTIIMKKGNLMYDR